MEKVAIDILEQSLKHRVEMLNRTHEMLDVHRIEIGELNRDIDRYKREVAELSVAIQILRDGNITVDGKLLEGNSGTEFKKG